MTKTKVLAVDDEPFNLDIMTDYLTDAGYDVITAEDGLIALEKLAAHQDIEVIVLDRMMPNMDGMEVLLKLKNEIKYRDIPVIMQTAAATSQQTLEGIQAGVHYYLTKPYEHHMFLGIVKTALLDFKNIKKMKEELHLQNHILKMMDHARFHIQTLDEAKNLACTIANCFPDPEKAILGLTELLVNAIEHGNLGITYAEKSKLILNGAWTDEVERRIKLPENQQKFVTLFFEKTTNEIKVHIKDQGKGFNYNKYMEISSDRITDPNGRGIAMAKMISFDKLDYIGCANEVICTLTLPQRENQ